MTDIPRRKKFTAPEAMHVKHGSLPPPPGTVLGHVSLQSVRGQEQLTEDERAIIEKAGWAPGEPIPDFRGTRVGQHMQEAVDAIQANAADHHGLSPIDPSTPPLEMPDPVDIESLPPDEQAAALKVFQEMDELQDRMNAIRQRKAKSQQPVSVMNTPVPPTAPDTGSGVELIDDIGATELPISPFQLKQAPAPAPTPEPEPQVEFSSHEQNSEGTGADLTGTTTYCPQCNFDLNSELVEPTTEDIAAYLSALLGEQRFRKEVKLFGGRITIIFRGLLPKEVDWAISLADKESAAGNVQHIMQYARIVEGYKLAMGVESITRVGHGTVTLPEASDIEVPADGTSPIVQMKEYINNDILTTDSLRRTVGSQWVKFNRLLQFMEAKAEDPDFFEVIA